MKGPGAAFFKAVQRQIGGMPFIAEDLGEITADVEKLRDDWCLPGMKVLQFAFGEGPENKFLPHHYPANTVVYTGTHDNDTTRGWFESLPAKQADFACRYAACAPDQIVPALIRLAVSSVANLAVIPMQDVLNLGSEARMNVPGRAAGNWRWRATKDQVQSSRLDNLAESAATYGRGRTSI